jgi:hypothetical protein
MTNSPTLADIRDACAMPQKGTRAYARVRLEAGLEIAFIRTNGRRNEPLEAWYLTNGDASLRIDEAQVQALLPLLVDPEILTTR